MQLETPHVSLGPVLEKLATSERITITVERLPSGNIRVKSNSWDHERVLLRNQVPEVRSVSDRLHVARKAEHPDQRDPPVALRAVTGNRRLSRRNALQKLRTIWPCRANRPDHARRSFPQQARPDIKGDALCARRGCRRRSRLSASIAAPITVPAAYPKPQNSVAGLNRCRDPSLRDRHARQLQNLGKQGSLREQQNTRGEHADPPRPGRPTAGERRPPRAPRVRRSSSCRRSFLATCVGR